MGKATRKTAVATPKVDGAIMTVADAVVAGGFKGDVAATVDQIRADLQSVDERRGFALYNAALLFHSAVTVGEWVQGDYADRLFGRRETVKGDDGTETVEPVKGSGKAMGTLLKRLSIAAVALQVVPGSVEWRFIVQFGATAKTAMLKGETRTVAQRKAMLRELTDAATAWDTGTAPKSRRKPAGETDQTDKGEGSGEGEGEGEGEGVKVALTPLQIAQSLDAALKREQISPEQWEQVETLLHKVIEREVTHLRKVAETARKTA
jgi:hypothetical protein